VTAARHCSRRDNRIGCFVGDNRARGLHANERVAPLNTSNAYIRAYLAPLSGAQTRGASRARGILDRVIDIYPSTHAHAHAIFSRRYPRDRAAISNIVVFNRLVTAEAAPPSRPSIFLIGLPEYLADA